MHLGRRRRGEGEVRVIVVVVVVVVVVIAETAGAPEACRTLPMPSLVLATFLFLDLGSGISFSSSSVEGLRLLLRLVCSRLLLLLAGSPAVSSVLSLSIGSSSVLPIRLRFPNRGSTTSCSPSVSSIGLLFLLLLVLPLLPSPAVAFYSSFIFSISDSTQSTLHRY
jgi:hypothetical protein